MRACSHVHWSRGLFDNFLGDLPSIQCKLRSRASSFDIRIRDQVDFPLADNFVCDQWRDFCNFFADDFVSGAADVQSCKLSFVKGVQWHY